MLLVPPSNTPLYLSFVCPVDQALQQVTTTAFVSLFAQFPGMTIRLNLAFKTGDVLGFLGVQSLR